ncbi:hypothetical protein, partial [Vibrio caribbeanicus]|uniref:hypothetical protein n=1 Tax=Vibrio caribbeanicus TaxID=701175 RepID=UPI001E2FF543
LGLFYVSDFRVRFFTDRNIEPSSPCVHPWNRVSIQSLCYLLESLVYAIRLLSFLGQENLSEW